MKQLLSILFLWVISTVQAQDFVTRQGNKLYYQGDEIMLRGMSFGNLVWVDSYADSPNLHHGEADIKRIKDLGMNAIRFYLNYKTFENDNAPFLYKQSGWDWIDSNVQWAKKHGIFLILNMHVPQGGFQSRCNGGALWNDIQNQTRLVALWKAIADRYKDEPQIAGFDLVNEPIPTNSIAQWSTLAQNLINAIREVNTNHLIITEKAIALNCDYGFRDENSNYPQIAEENLMYTVHIYDPFEFTHQQLDWANTGEGGAYPDPNRINAPSDLQYATGQYANPSIATGTTDWRKYIGIPFTVTHDSLIAGRVVFTGNRIGSGTVFFDDIELLELDGSNNPIRTIFSQKLSQSANIWFWSQDGTGNQSSSSTGHLNDFSITMTGNQSAASITMADFVFKAIKGHRYAISGWMKGENIPTNANATITTEFYYSPSGQQVFARDRNYIKSRIVEMAKYVTDRNFPVYYGEFGVSRPGFEDDRGGERWTKDCMEIFDSLGFHFTYHAYKESSFGYYDGWDQPVDTSTVNRKLQQVFVNHFGRTTSLSYSKINQKVFFEIVPNPAKERIKIKVKEAHLVQQVQVIDVSGRILYNGKALEINIKDLQRGSYVVKVSKLDGSTSVAKFVKE